MKPGRTVYRSGGGYLVRLVDPGSRLPYAVRRPDGRLLARCADRLLAQALVGHLNPAPDPADRPQAVDRDRDEFAWSSADQPDRQP